MEVTGLNYFWVTFEVFNNDFACFMKHLICMLLGIGKGIQQKDKFSYLQSIEKHLDIIIYFKKIFLIFTGDETKPIVKKMPFLISTMNILLLLRITVT